jgi:uncharacterized protein (DUF58 family)
MKVRRRKFRDLQIHRNNMFDEYSEFSFFDRYRHFGHPSVFYFVMSLSLLILSGLQEEGRFLLIGLYAMLVVLAVSRIRTEFVAKKIRLSHRPLKRIYREGDEIEVVIEIENRSGTNLTNCLIEDHLQVASEPDIRLPVFQLDAYSRLRKRFRVRCDSGMGRKAIGPLRLSISDVTGAFEFEILSDEDHEVDVFPHISNLPNLRVTPSADFQHFGIYEVSNRGTSVSLAGIRNYDSGDSPRHISWRLSTRGRGLVVKDFEKSVNSTIYIVLNLQPFWQFGKGADSTWEYAKDVALAVASQQSQLGNFVGFMSGATIVNPAMGENHIYEIASKVASLNLDSVVTEKSALTADVSELKFGSIESFEPLFAPGSEVYYIVPFNEREFDLSERSLRRLLASGFHVNIVFIDVGAFWRKYSGSIPASHLMPTDLFKRLPKITKDLRSKGIRVFLASPETSFSKTFHPSENPI